jgi:two-component system LytT family response regulator
VRVAVVDDEPLARSGVIARLARHADIEVIAQYADGAAALAGIARHPPDLLFLDIEMPTLHGIDMLDAIAPEQRPLVVLLTAHEQFAIQAFALNVVDYLLKPVEDDRFAEALARARTAWRMRCGSTGPLPAPVEPWLQSFSVRLGSRMLFVHAADVEWIEASGDYATLHADGRELLVRESLHRLAQRLDPARFVRVHRSAIVRIDQVAEMQTLTNRDALLCLRDGTPIRASRTYIDELSAALARQRTLPPSRRTT